MESIPGNWTILPTGFYRWKSLTLAIAVQFYQQILSADTGSYHFSFFLSKSHSLFTLSVSSDHEDHPYASINGAVPLDYACENLHLAFLHQQDNSVHADWSLKNMDPKYSRCWSTSKVCPRFAFSGRGGRMNFMDLVLLLLATSPSDDSKKLPELRRRIEKYFGGDEDAIPSIFEAILKRKLAGKHEDSDDGSWLANNVSDEEFDSEEDES